MNKDKSIRIFKSELYKLPLFFGYNSAMCPSCGVISNVFPDYSEENGTAVSQHLSYCGHKLEINIALMVIGIPKEINE